MEQYYEYYNYAGEDRQLGEQTELSSTYPSGANSSQEGYLYQSGNPFQGEYPPGAFKPGKGNSQNEWHPGKGGGQPGHHGW